MRKQFDEFYKLADDEVANVWKSGLICFDSNVLLNLYTYSDETATEILSLIRSHKSQIWLPFTSAHEYHQIRLSAIEKETKRYPELKGSVEKIKQVLTSRKNHPVVAEDLANEFGTVCEKVILALSKENDKFRSLLDNDRILDEITEIFEGRVGEPYSEEELDKIYKEGALRYKKRIPPGFKDDDKPEPNRYGDLVIWKEVLEVAKDQKKPVIFVTDDAKADWWRMLGAEPIGARTELVAEFKRTAGMRVLFYGTDGFVNQAGVHRGKKISLATKSELKDATKVNRRTNRTMAEVKENAEILGLLLQLQGGSSKKSIQQKQDALVSSLSNANKTPSYEHDKYIDFANQWIDRLRDLKSTVDRQTACMSAHQKKSFLNSLDFKTDEWMPEELAEFVKNYLLT